MELIKWSWSRWKTYLVELWPCKNGAHTHIWAHVFWAIGINFYESSGVYYISIDHKKSKLLYLSSVFVFLGLFLRGNWRGRHEEAKVSGALKPNHLVQLLDQRQVRPELSLSLSLLLKGKEVLTLTMVKMECAVVFDKGESQLPEGGCNRGKICWF